MTAIQRIWRHGRIATLVADGEHYGIIDDGAIAVGDRRILWVGPADELPPGPTSRSCDEHPTHPSKGRYRPHPMRSRLP